MVAAGVGVLLVVVGWGHQTGLRTVSGEIAEERQLVQAFSVSGLKYKDRLAPPTPRGDGDAAGTARAFEQWERQRAAGKGQRWEVQVDTEAKTPCPT
jgi:hypothetical protein